MIRIQLTPDSLGTARFVVSPLKHLRVALDSRLPASSVDGFPSSAEVVEVIRRHRLRRLALLRGLVDDFAWAPAAPASFRPGLDEELHAMVRAHSDLVPRLTAHVNRTGLLAGSAQAVRRGALRELLVGRGEEFTAALGAETEQFFRHVLAPHWSTMAARVESEIDLRGRMAARGGFRAMLSGLHPAIGCEGDVLVVHDRREVSARAQGQVTFFPTAIGSVPLTDLGRGPSHAPVALTYPIGRREEPGGRGEGSLDEVLGQSRVRLLASLGEARTTSQLASMHHLSPSTVSYHLSRLHGAGLVTRTRMGSSVYYQRSPKAEIFSPRAAVSGCSPGGGRRGGAER